MIRLILFLILKFFLGAEAGASLPWSKKWQDKRSWYSEVPEAIDALLIAHLAVTGWSYIFPMHEIYSLGLSYYYFGLSLGAWLYPLFTAIAYAGIQSATWLFLQWEGHDNPDTDKDSTTKPLVDLIADKLGFKLGDEGYSWVAAAVKGTIITLPLGGLGGIFFATGYEIGSHAKGRVDKYFNPHIVSEGMSFVGLGIYAIIFITICKFIAGF